MRALVPVLAIAALSVAPPAWGYPNGKFDSSRPPGCFCHNSLISPTPTQVLVTGLPESYVAGETYPLSVWVLGVPTPGLVNPTQDGALVQTAGFNLRASAGELVPVDETSRVRRDTECTFLDPPRHPLDPSGVHPDFEGRATYCERRDPETGLCLVFDDPGCPSYRFNDSDCRVCGADDDGASCRVCDDATVLNSEATHSPAGGISVSPEIDDVTLPRTDGNNRFTWDLLWVAPAAGTGDVHFYAAGNVANSNNQADFGDLWAFMEPEVTVTEAR
jgi:hypothetical protein